MLSTTLKKLAQPAKSAAAVLLVAVAVSIAIPNTSALLLWLAANLIIAALWLVSSSSSSSTTTSNQSSYPDIYVLPVISSLYSPEADAESHTPEISPTTDKLVDKSVVESYTPEISPTTDKLVDESLVKEEELPKRWDVEEKETQPEANVADDDDESMEATWKAIMQRMGSAVRPVVRKTETWGLGETTRLERVAAEKGSAQKAMRKSVTKKETGGGGGGGRKREVMVVGNDELLRRAESMIRRHHDNLRLQRQESEQRRHVELRGHTGNPTNTYVPVRV